MKKAELKEHLLTRHGPEQLEAIRLSELPDHLNTLSAINVKLNREFGHDRKPSLLWKLRNIRRRHKVVE